MYMHANNTPLLLKEFTSDFIEKMFSYIIRNNINDIFTLLKRYCLYECYML